MWPRVQRRLATVGVQFDPWQQGFSSAALGCRADGLYAASVGGVVESVPRQVGKTYKIGNLILGICAEFPRTRVAWTSHHNRTTTDTFRTMKGLVSRPKMRGLLAPNGIRNANGEQEIKFANGSIVMFGAREQGFGRGIPELDILVFDESQILSMKALEDMVPATNQAKHPHGGLVFFLGTPPRPTDDGEAFTALRRAAITGRSPDRMFVEISADPDAAWDDRTQWRKMNPSYPHRTPEAAMLRMRELIPDEDAWRREAMGIWDEGESDEVWGVVSKTVWRTCRTKETDEQAAEPGWLVGPVALALEMNQDRTRSTIAAAGACREGGIGIDIVADGEGTAWVIRELVARTSDPDKPISHVVIDDRSPAGALTADLTAAGVTVTEPATQDVVKATGYLIDSANEAGIVQRDRPELTRGAAVAKLRKYGESKIIDRQGSPDAVPFIAANLAVWGHLQPVEAPAEADFLVI